MPVTLPPPPPTNSVLDRWLNLLWRKFSASGELDHNSGGGIQGGTTDEYYHLTATQHTDLTDSGTTTLHTHDASTLPTSRIAGSTYSTVQHLQDIFHSAGHVNGGNITDNGDGTVNVSAGTGLIRATNSAVANVMWFDWSAATNVSLTDNDENYIYIDYNAGAPVVTSSTTEPTNHHTTVQLAHIYRSGTDLHINETVRPTVGDHAAQMILAMQETMPYARVSGGIIGETGTRNLTITAGVFWFGLLRFTTAAFDSSVAGTFTYYYRDGVGGWTEGSPVTQINNTQYDNGSGTLQNLTANRYGVAWIYLAVDGDVHALYGQGDYTSIQVEDVQPPASIPPELQTDSFLIGKIIIQQGASVFASVESAFDSMFSTVSVTQHNDLGGLQGGTSAQYYHLTSAEYTGTGTGAFVRSTGPTIAGATVNGNITFTGTGNRISGDFSNATLSNRVLFQTSTVSSSTNIHAVGNGAGFGAGFKCEDGALLTTGNASTGTIDIVPGVDFRISSGIRGSGTYLPMTFYTSGSERMRIDTSGHKIMTGGLTDAADDTAAATAGVPVNALYRTGSAVKIRVT